MRLTLGDAPTRETRRDHNIGNPMPNSVDLAQERSTANDLKTTVGQREALIRSTYFKVTMITIAYMYVQCTKLLTWHRGILSDFYIWPCVYVSVFLGTTRQKKSKERVSQYWLFKYMSPKFE